LQEGNQNWFASAAKSSIINKDMLLVTFFFAELFLLFLLSKKLTRLLSFFFYHKTRSQKATINYLALLFFPGTFVHELSHFLMAVFLNVRVGDMEFMPQIQEHGVKLGSVSIAHTDPFRRLLIGMAPFLFGTGIILSLLYFGAKYELFSIVWFILLTGYAVFEIGNTMFSSRKDMEGALELLIVLFVLAIILYLTGLRLPAIDPNVIFENPLAKQIFEKGSIFLLVPLGIDIVIVTLLSFFRRRKRL
jgi:hypothetical protein